jgi:hypothetical protein
LTNTTISIGNSCIAGSTVHLGGVLYWSIKDSNSWLVIGSFGLLFQHWEDNNNTIPHIRHPNHEYSIIGVDAII